MPHRTLATEVSNPSHAPWDLISSYIKFRSDDAQFWWDSTGRMFARLLEAAGYSHSDQYRELFFYATWVIPGMGPAPDVNGKHTGAWSSVWAPGGTPVEFSWDFGQAGDNPMVRFSWEPIGRDAGTPLDPLNSFAATEWFDRVKQQNLLPGLETAWYHHFVRHMLPPPDMRRVKTADSVIEATTPVGGIGIAIDIEPSGRQVSKPLLYPGLRALELGISNLEMVERAVRALPAEQLAALNVDPLFDYLHEATARWGMETGIVCIDCLKPEESRIKIYVRAPHTSVDWLMDGITLGGRYDPKAIYGEETVQDLADLWQAFLKDAPDAVPTDKAPARASPGFYFTIGAGKKHASPKMYLSPSHFVKNDQEVVDRLREFFATRRKPAKTETMDNYEAALKDIYGPLLKKPDYGTIFYVGAAMTKNGLRVVTYHDPQVVGSHGRADLFGTKYGDE
ncbi:putative dimethylallyl tryptophan synthase [Cladorrhinum samala]|uniref:Dimethylallyl tryptophan synthase n=1 Tax=Cladorrhinum samala TaxID=585594 RepID=A0AAV9H9X4_9PEZI|nr:putative dimethylallyl tryptophan synthase [Cladorrhinum samala]